jgi:hypothetical protein
MPFMYRRLPNEASDLQTSLWIGSFVFQLKESLCIQACICTLHPQTIMQAVCSTSASTFKGLALPRRAPRTGAWPPAWIV